MKITKPRRSHRRYRPLALETIEPRRMLAFGVELVADINTITYSPPTNPQAVVDVNGTAFYTSKSVAHGYELWKSDGTPEGTTLVKDIVPGPGQSFPYQLTNVNGTLYFSVNTPDHGHELWRSDGTDAGTRLVADLKAGAPGSVPASLVNVDGSLYFTADDGVHGRELWKSDGTAAGTVMVRDIVAGAGSPQPDALFAANGLVFFVANDMQGRRRLWRTDGTESGTFRIGQHNSPANLTAVNGSVFFTQATADAGTELWVTDGRTINTRLVADIRPGAASSSLAELTNVNGTLFFRADDGSYGAELWKSDGVETVLVRDLDVGPIGYPGSFGPTHLINFNGILYFASKDCRSIWKSDGSESGTLPVAGVQGPGPSIFMQSPFTKVDNLLYFANLDGDGIELWKSDGTKAGTVLVKDIYPGSTPGYDYSPSKIHNSNPRYLSNVGGLLFFTADDTDNAHLWVSGGTNETTVPVDKLDVRTFSASATPGIGLEGKLLFTANDGNGVALWSSDGTAGGTQRLADTQFAASFANINGTVLFSGSVFPGTHAELWKSDGTSAGTVQLANINPHYSSQPSGFVELNGKAIFAAAGRRTRREPWITDGTSAGTVLIKDIFPLSYTGSDPTGFLRRGNAVYFAASDALYGRELWRTDGTSSGTRIVKEISPGVNTAGPEDLLVFKNELYFSANDGTHGRELWQSNGTAAGTIMLKDLTPGAVGSNPANLTEVRGTLYFTTSPDGGDKLLWKSDGTAAGTVFVANIGTATELTNANGVLYFASNVGGTGAELWKSNGTAGGTVRIKDLIPGPGSSHPRELQEANGVLFFVADLPNGGRGFWRSNGTAEGTVPVLENPAPLTSVRFLTNVNGQLFFAGTDGEHGEELWKLTTANPTVQFSGTLNYRENSPLRLIAPFARISDADNAAFPGGTLSVVIEQNAGGSDRIQVRHQGNGPGQIGVDWTFSSGGPTIRYGGVAIGSMRDGLPGSRLIIDLNANASPTIVQALLRNIGYRNTSDNPSTKPRTVVVTLTDGSGGISAPLSKTINVEAVNDPPRLALGGQLSYRNNSTSILLAPAAVVSDVDSANFSGGVLTVRIDSGRGPTNRLRVSGAFSTDSGRLLRNGVVVGTVLQNGSGWRDLSFRFNSRMTAANVQELVRSLRFRTLDNTNLDPRIISFSLSDGDGGVSETRLKTVNMKS